MSDTEARLEIDALAHPATLEDELQAMSAIVNTFDRLDRRAQRRVLDWAKSRYGSHGVAMDTIMDLMTSFLEAAGEHQKATKQPRQIDRDLWDATIKGTRYWTAPADNGDTDSQVASR